MRFHPLAIPLAVAAWGAVACNASPAASLDPSLEAARGDFDYTAYDSDGILTTVLLVGRLTLDIDSDGTVSGTWTIEWAPGADTTTQVGPQVGSGDLRGSIEGGRVFIDLNPGWADHNVFLAGTLEPERIAGGWSYSSFIGPTADGSFVARRR